eukprot:gnl/TRDRNA2_/TRDRNA2_186691_c0_seq1.p1 gnl/TRDRNA2_/TRDRNA2_186691_c0~~gnl/TRDRNA2_/TRDRNA2_186691_c0_seq1.p1  ORF type:complete len:107 (-),score=29.39 gnl/TRDRNA2_/TRDRNA2_186691_c0_seq1:40-360(-)
MPRGLFTSLLDALHEASVQLHQDMLQVDGCNCAGDWNRSAGCLYGNGKKAAKNIKKALSAADDAADHAFTLDAGTNTEHVVLIHNEAAKKAADHLRSAKEALDKYS